MGVVAGCKTRKKRGVQIGKVGVEFGCGGQLSMRFMCSAASQARLELGRGTSAGPQAQQAQQAQQGCSTAGSQGQSGERAWQAGGCSAEPKVAGKGAGDGAEGRGG